VVSATSHARHDGLDVRAIHERCRLRWASSPVGRDGNHARERQPRELRDQQPFTSVLARHVGYTAAQRHRRSVAGPLGLPALLHFVFARLAFGFTSHCHCSVSCVVAISSLISSSFRCSRRTHAACRSCPPFLISVKSSRREPIHEPRIARFRAHQEDRARQDPRRRPVHCARVS